MAMRFEDYSLPESWAVYLINGDSDSLTEKEEKAINAWLESIGNPYCAGTADDSESEFSYRHDAFQFWPYGGNVVNITFQFDT